MEYFACFALKVKNVRVDRSWSGVEDDGGLASYLVVVVALVPARWTVVSGFNCIDITTSRSHKIVLVV